MKAEPLWDPALALTEVLEAQARLFDELREMSSACKQAVLAADAARLAELSPLAETLATRFALLESERTRLEAAYSDLDDARLAVARRNVAAALGRLLREAAVAGTVLERLADTVHSRSNAVWALCGNAYLPDGRSPVAAAACGGRLSAEG